MENQYRLREPERVLTGQQSSFSETRTSGSAEGTREIGAALGRLLRGGEVVVLTGPFGAGKTVFAQGIADGLGIDDHLTSPSFTLANSYPSEAGGPGIHHLDLYRVTSIEEALTFGLEEYFEDDAVTLIEWPGDVGSALGEEAVRVEIAIEEEDRRRIAMSIPAGMNGVLEQLRSTPENETKSSRPDEVLELAKQSRGDNN